jgi:hypothetical protein
MATEPDYDASACFVEARRRAEPRSAVLHQFCQSQ